MNRLLALRSTAFRCALIAGETPALPAMRVQVSTKMKANESKDVGNSYGMNVTRLSVRAVFRDTLLPKLVSGEMSVRDMMNDPLRR